MTRRCSLVLHTQDRRFKVRFGGLGHVARDRRLLKLALGLVLAGGLSG